MQFDPFMRRQFYLPKLYRTSVFVLLLSLLVGLSGYAQRTIFQQNFSSAGPFTSRTPNSTQFDTIYVQNGATLKLAPSQGFVEFERTGSSGSGSGRIVRSTNLSPVPTTMYYQVKVMVPQASSNTTNVATFNVGQNLSSTNNAIPPDLNIFAKFSMSFKTGNIFNFRRTGSSPLDSDPYLVSVVLTWVMNNTAESLPYITPLGTADAIAPQAFDLWVDNTRFLRNSPRVSSSPVELSDVSFRMQDGIGSIQLTDFLIRDVDGVLPVNLTYFNAQAIGNQVELNWETAWERNSREFIVQRSADLKEFGDVGRVVAMGKTDGRQTYSFTDPAPLLGTNYYRLRMVDTDNTYEYSKVRDVIVRPDQPTLWLAGNPTTGERIRFRSSSVDVSALRLTTIMGQNISFRLTQNSDGFTELIPSSVLSPGMYFLSVNQDGYRSHTKVLVH